MKKLFIALMGVTLASANVYADTADTVTKNDDNAATEYSEMPIVAETYEQYPEILHQIYYQDEHHYSKFFIGLETPFISSGTVKISDDIFDESVKTTTFNLNNGIFDGMSLLFGLDTGDTGRYSLLISHTQVDTGATDTKAGAYSLRADIPIARNQTIIPFARLGIGYVTAENDDDDFSAMAFVLGLGASYNISQNVFAYGVLQYAWVPETEIGDTDLNYEEHAFSFSLGLGYRF